MKIDFRFCVETIENLLRLIKVAEESEKLTGPEKREEVIKAYSDFISCFPCDEVPEIFKNIDFVGSLIDLLILLANLFLGKKKAAGERAFLFVRKGERI